MLRILLLLVILAPLVLRARDEIEVALADDPTPPTPAVAPAVPPPRLAPAAVEAALRRLDRGRGEVTDPRLDEVSRQLTEVTAEASRFGAAYLEECDAEGIFSTGVEAFACPVLRQALARARADVRDLVERRRRLEKEASAETLTALLTDWLNRCRTTTAGPLPPLAADAAARLEASHSALAALRRDANARTHLLGSVPALEQRWADACRVSAEGRHAVDPLIGQLALLDGVCGLLGARGDGRAIAADLLRRQLPLPPELPLDPRVRLVSAGGASTLRERRQVHVWWKDGRSEPLLPKYDEFRVNEDRELNRRIDSFDPTGKGGVTFPTIAPTERSRAARQYNEAIRAIGALRSLDALRRLRRDCEPVRDYLDETWTVIDSLVRAAESRPALFDTALVPGRAEP